MAFAKGETLRFLKGESMLHEYKTASGSRSFCGECGSRLMNFAPNKADYLGIALSCLAGSGDFVELYAELLVGIDPALTSP